MYYDKVLLCERRLSDEEFVLRFAEQAVKLSDMGFSAQEVRNTMAEMEWVRDYAMQPMMFELAEKLPRGAKWSQGQKLGGQKAKGKKAIPVPPLVFLDVDGDLYIKGIGVSFVRNEDGSYKRGEDGRRYMHDAIAVIRDWRQYMAGDVVNAYQFSTPEGGDIVCGAFYQWYHEHGEQLNNLPILHKPGRKAKRALEDPPWSRGITPEFLKVLHHQVKKDPEHWRFVKNYYGWDIEPVHPETIGKKESPQSPPSAEDQ